MGNILPWTSTAQQKIKANDEQRERRIQLVQQKVNEYGQDIAEREKIQSLSLIELRDALQRNNYSATQVLYAYACKALEVHAQLNCVAEFLPEAFDEATKLDAKYADGKEKKPPLFGLPFSVKANFFLKGYDSCIGLANWLCQPRTTDCTFVTLLRQLGAVPFCYTNVPQTLLSFVCSNPVYGTTGNPHDMKRTPGGSSGGDAALLAAGGTAFATGGDIGGSLRIPAHFCGLVTLKPCQGRFEIENAHSGMPGHGRLGLGTGVFAKSVDELRMLLLQLLGNPNYHGELVPKCVPLPLDLEKMGEWDEKASGGKLRIGYHTNDGFLKPVPACARVVQESVEKLRAMGHEVVLFQIPEPEQIALILYKNFLPEGGAYIRQLFADNPVDQYMKKTALMLRVPIPVRWLLAHLLDWISPQLAVVLRSYVRTPEDVRRAQAGLDEYTKKFTELWLAEKLDALVVPAFPVPSVPHRWPSDMVTCAFATGLYNALDYPAGIVPVGKVTKEDDLALADETQWETGHNIQLKWVRSAAANSVGLPVGVQVVALPWEEEKCLAVMKVLDGTGQT